jgi:hypothetical protein
VNGPTVQAIRRTAVCVVRAEPQGSGLLFSVTGNTDIEHRTLTHVYGHAVDIPTTLALVRRFLEEVDVLDDLDQDASMYHSEERDSP